ncbi:MAG: hypothetical protein WA939_21300 [Nodosilinea sp.]
MGFPFLDAIIDSLDGLGIEDSIELALNKELTGYLKKLLPESIKNKFNLFYIKKQGKGMLYR